MASCFLVFSLLQHCIECNAFSNGTHWYPLRLLVFCHHIQEAAFWCLCFSGRLLVSSHMLSMGHHALLLVAQALVSLLLQAVKLLAIHLHKSLEVV
jgi:hypothetical protein